MYLSTHNLLPHPLSPLAFCSTNHGATRSLGHRRQANIAFLCNSHYALVLPLFFLDNVPNSTTSVLNPCLKLHWSESKTNHNAHMRLHKDLFCGYRHTRKQNTGGIGDAVLNQDYHFRIHQLFFAYNRNS